MKAGVIGNGFVGSAAANAIALQNAASLAGLLMTTEAMVTEKPKKGGLSEPAMPPEDMY